MKQNEVKRPSALKTMFEVLYFLANKTYLIPSKHHFNMVELKGCCKKAFVYYLQEEHMLSDESILLMVNSKKPVALTLFLENYQHGLSDACIDALCKKIGLAKILEHGFRIGPKYINQLIGKNDTKTLSLYLDKMAFNIETEAQLLNLKNSSLTEQYLTTQHLSPLNRKLILQYDTPSVYVAFATNSWFSEEMAAEILAHKAEPIVRVLLESGYTCSYDDIVKLIERDDEKLFRTYLLKGSLSKEAETYLAEHGSDQLFIAYLQFKDWSNDTVPALCDRLFDPKYQETLKDILSTNRLQDDIELKLLESGNQELIDLYLSAEAPLSLKAIAWLIKHDCDGTNQALLANAYPLGYYAEAKLFQSGNAERINAYLKKNDLCPFSEAMLIKYADAEIAAGYIREHELDIYAFCALVMRHDRKLLEMWFADNDYYDDEMLAFFFRNAEIETILAFLNYLLEKNNGEPLVLSVSCPDGDYFFGKIIFQRGNRALNLFLIEHCILTENDEMAMLHNVSNELFLLYCKQNHLYEETQIELIRSGNKEVIKSYLSMLDRNMCAEAEQELLLLLDEELVLFYQNSFGIYDYNVDDALGL